MTQEELLKVSNLLSKARLLGGDSKVMTDWYVIERGKYETIVYFGPLITDDMNPMIPRRFKSEALFRENDKRQKLIVIGGENLSNISNLFAGLFLSELDISEFRPKNLVSTDGLFYHSHIDKVTGFDSLDTHKVEKMSWMFEGSVIKDIDISSLDTSSVTDMTDMFMESVIDNLDFSNFNTSKVITMTGMFASVRIKKLDISNFDTSSVRTMVDMFKESKIDELNISWANTASLRLTKGMFYKLRTNKLDLSTMDTFNVADMSRMFFGACVPKINLSSFITSEVTSMREMFQACRTKELNLSNFDTSRVKDMSKMFMWANIQKLDISSFHATELKKTEVNGMFYKCNVHTLRISDVLKRYTSAKNEELPKCFDMEVVKISMRN